MNFVASGAIDCDVHPFVPHVRVLIPYLDDYWRDMAETRGIDGFLTRSYPPGAALSCRPDWLSPDRVPGGGVEQFDEQLFERWGCSLAILNCLYGAPLVHDPHLGAGHGQGHGA